MTETNSKTTKKLVNEAGSKENQLSFEQAYTELETIVAQMESAQMPLQTSLAAYTRGNFLLQHCQQSLAKVPASSKSSIRSRAVSLPLAC